MGNEIIGLPWTEATAEMSLEIRATPIITDHSVMFSYQYQYQPNSEFDDPIYVM